ncbi:MAG: AAA family ATPase [Bacillota bacterium]|nr:AAA family ATPase [Bacillota bacterium]
MEKIKVLVAGVQGEERDSINEALANVEYISATDGANTAEDVLQVLDESHVDVVLVNAQISGNGYSLTEKIAEQFPGVAVVIMEYELKEETMRQALFSGAKDVLLYPFTPSKLVDSLYRSYQLERKKQAMHQGKPMMRKKANQGKMITVFGTKGGIGKTFVATNLAVSLAEYNGNRVALVDLDLDFGNAALALNIIPKFTISDVVNEIAHLDQDLLESYLIPHSSGVKLLAANAQPQMTEFVTAEHVSFILRLLQNAFDYVVVDMPARFYSPVDPALQEADLLLLITTPEVVALRNIKSCLNTFALLKYPPAKIKLLLNKVDSRDDIKLKDVEVTLNSKVFGALQADHRLVCSSMNQGIPVVTLYPRSKISRGFYDLAVQISGSEKSWKEKAARKAESEEVYQEAKS